MIESHVKFCLHSQVILIISFLFFALNLAAQSQFTLFFELDSSNQKKWGCVNQSTFDTIIPAIYDRIDQIEEYGARYRQGQRWGLLDDQCQVVFDANENNYVNRYSINYNWYWVVTDSEYKMGLYSSDFKEILSQEYGLIKPLNHLVIAVKKDSLVGLMNSSFELILPYEYNSISEFSGGYAKITKGNEVGFIGIDGRVVLEAKYKSSGWLVENRLAVYNGDKFGFVDSTGELVIPYRFTSAQNFNNGLTAVYCNRELDSPTSRGSNLNPQVGVINIEGKWILPPKYKHAIVGHKNGIIEVVNNDKSSLFFNPDTLNPLPDYWYSNNTTIGLGGNISLVLVMNQLGERYSKKTSWPYCNSNTLQKDKKYWVMDAAGDTLLNEDYNYACYDSITIYLRNKGKWKYFDSNKLKVRPVNKHPKTIHVVYGRSNDTATMGYGVINKKGRLVVPFSFKQIEYDGINFTCQKPNKNLLIDSDGNLVLPK